MADAGEHFLEPGADLTLTDLLGAPLDTFGRLIHLGLVGGADRSAGESQGREESGSDPQPVKSPCHDAPPLACLAQILEIVMRAAERVPRVAHPPSAWTVLH